MNVKEVKNWLKKIEDDELVRVYIKTEEESLISPNMGYALRDEIFEWQDKLDQIEYSDGGFTELYLLTEDILGELESRLAISPEFVKEMDEIHQKIVNGDTSDFELVELPKRSFFDYVNDYCEATKIGEVLQACTLLIYYVKNRVKGVECDIYDGRLWITRVGNASVSTSILSELIGIKAKNIDDSRQEEGVWSIHLYKR